MQRSLAAALLGALALTGCAHLFQSQTWTSDSRTLDLQQSEYLTKELVLGLPEEVFRRWYTRVPAWTDPLRPSIRGSRTEGPITIYDVGSDAGLAGEVAFRGGALDHWARWHLTQESVVSAWMKVEVAPRRVSPENLARIAGLDPAADVLHREERPDPARECALSSGSAVDTLVPILFDREHGNRLERWYPSKDVDDRGGQVSTLPPGTRLTVTRWDPVHGRRLTDSQGTAYKVDLPLGIDAFADLFCPSGRCAAVGSEGVVAEDLAILADEDKEKTALAVLPGRYRVPVWMEKTGLLPAGTVVRVRRWTACSTMEAEIETLEGGAVAAARLSVPVAPPGLFRPR